MGRVKNLKMLYSEQPANCPMCGKHTVVEVGTEDREKLAQCGTLLFKQAE